MKNQMKTLRRVGVRALGLAFLIGCASACTDDYTLDDEKPEWLGESVYSSLKSGQFGSFQNYLRLMDDLGMKDVLNRTGSRTVFAANDSAFEAFYAANALLSDRNPWKSATSYDKLTDSQKALLAKSTMLNNSMTVETLSTQENTLERGLYLRRPTLVSVADSVSYLQSNELPYSYNQTGDFDFWSEFRSASYMPGSDNGEGTGIYLTDGDGTNNMMICFTPEQMSKRTVTDGDFEVVMGVKRNPTDVYINDAKVIGQDITCQNGYIDMVDKVIRPLPNMAEALRTCDETHIFSHILDRYSAPVYVSSYNEMYKLSHEDFTGKIFTKWYFSETGASSLIGNAVTLTTNDNGEKVFRITTGEGNSDYIQQPMSTLKFDPAWNSCALVAGSAASEDMAAMFVPTDATLLEAFQAGSLFAMIEEYAGGVDESLVNEARNATLGNLEPLYKAIDQIPLNILDSYVRNLMRESYNSSVASKFNTLKNDAQEALFGGNGCSVDTTLICCNGVVYVTKSFHSPADYASVAAPAYINKDKRIMKWAIYSGLSTAQTDYMRGLNYYAYLKAMTSRYTLFLPDDEALHYIYNPMSFRARYPRLISLDYNEAFETKGTGNPINNECYNYDIETGKKSTKQARASLTMNDVGDVMSDILQTHTLVHNSEADLISQQRNLPAEKRDRFFMTKSNDAVKVTYAADGSLSYIQGGFQIENEQRGLTQPAAEDAVNRGTVYCRVKSASEYIEGGNGDTYILDAPAIPAVKTVYGILSEHDAFKAFLNLCDVDQELITGCGFYEGLELKDKNRLEQNMYSVFVDKDASLDEIVPFFNQYQYTVFVPTEAALQKANDQHYFYTWEQIRADYEENTYLDDVENIRRFNSKDDSIRVCAKVTQLFNFIRFHFMDTSVFADNTAWNDNLSNNNFATSCFYQTTPTSGNFMKLHVVRNGNGAMTVQGLNLEQTTLCGEPANVLEQTSLNAYGINVPLRNMMAREIIVVNNSNAEAVIRDKDVGEMNSRRIGTSSSAVVHLIDKALVYTEQAIDLDDNAQARRYLKYNKVVNKEQHD